MTSDLILWGSFSSIVLLVPSCMTEKLIKIQVLIYSFSKDFCVIFFMYLLTWLHFNFKFLNQPFNSSSNHSASMCRWQKKFYFHVSLKLAIPDKIYLFKYRLCVQIIYVFYILLQMLLKFYSTLDFS